MISEVKPDSTLEPETPKESEVEALNGDYARKVKERIAKDRKEHNAKVMAEYKIKTTKKSK